MLYYKVEGYLLLVTTTATARTTANIMFMLTNNKFARASGYFVLLFTVVAPLRHETS